jgi:Baseplate J-like protein
MPIPPVTLDDLTWSDLTAATRARVPAASNGRWTLHAPVDPGITLLELHAWLLEQRLYWMNQVPDSLNRGALALIGEAALDAQCAGTVLQFNFDPAQPAMRRIPAGAQMVLQDSDPPLIFSLTMPLTVLPLAPAQAGVAVPCPVAAFKVGEHDRSVDLRAGRAICLFAASGEELQITLTLTQPVTAPHADDAMTLAFVLDDDGNAVPAEWSSAAVAGIAPPAQLSWWYEGAQGRTQFAAASVRDGTGGLRRSGIACLPLPADWQPSAPDAAGNVSYTLFVRAESASFAALPQLVGLWPNVAIVQHRRRARRRLTPDWLPLPGCTIALDDTDRLPLVDGTRLRLRERDGQWHWWRPTADLTFHGREDRVFVIDRAAGTLHFGNGETGRIPLPGWGFTAVDLADPSALALAWQDGGNALAGFLRDTLPAAARGLVDAFTAGQTPSAALRRALLDGLNAVLDAAPLYTAARFDKIKLDDDLNALVTLDAAPGGQAQRRLNRRLLEAAYPAALRAIPPVDLRLSLGGGEAGNVGAFGSWEPVDPAPQPVPLALNILPGADGTEPEPLDAARQRAAAALRRPDRAVIADDFVSLARTTPGVDVRRAHAAVGFHPDFPCRPVPGAVTLFIVPDAARLDGGASACPRTIAPVPDPATLAAVSARVEGARLLASEVYVRAPIYRQVAITVDIQGSPVVPDAVRADVAARLGDFLDPLIGGAGNDGWPFGEPLRPSTLLREAQAAVGDRGDVVQLAIRLLDVAQASDQSCEDVAIGPHALVALASVKTRLSAPALASGGLQ